MFHASLAPRLIGCAWLLSAIAFLHHPASAVSESRVLSGPVSGSSFGSSVASVGDVNGDGISDLLVGSPFYAKGGDLDLGRVDLYLGRPELADSMSVVEPDWTLIGSESGARLGAAVSSAGDSDADGFFDFVVAEPGFDGSGDDRGRVLFFRGGSGGPQVSADATLEGTQSNAGFGQGLAFAGDLDGDGFDDFVVASSGHDGVFEDTGRVEIYRGSVTGPVLEWTVEGESAGARLGASLDWVDAGWIAVGAPGFAGSFPGQGRVYLFTAGEHDDPLEPLWTLDGGAESESLGISVAGVGDYDGDGFGDFVVGQSGGFGPGLPNAGGSGSDLGTVTLYYGGETAPKKGATALPAPRGVTSWATTVRAAGDIDGDGFADIVAGGGSPRTFRGQVERPLLLDQADDTLQVPLDAVVATVGPGSDLNGDGFHDVVCGSPTTNDVVLFFGRARDVGTEPAWTRDGNESGALLGNWVSIAGDVNGDGYDDVAVASVGASVDGLSDGAVSLHFGSACGLSPDPVWQVAGGQDDGGFGVSHAPAGDVNGDGFDDFIIGSHTFDDEFVDEGRALLFLGSETGLGTVADWETRGEVFDARLGISVDGAGDVNGDGYSDVIIGAHHYDGNRGRAYVFLGSPNGLGASPVWTGFGEQPEAFYAISVAGAGDVNGDGYDDILVGAFLHDEVDDDVGKAFLYLGGATGPDSAAAWMQVGEAGAHLGVSVAAAGDVNGDGFDDVLLGADEYTNNFNREGEVQLFLGGALGLGPVPDWRYGRDQRNSGFGRSVHSAHDVDADGFSDVLVGAYLADSGQFNEGQVFLFKGGPGGLENAPTWVGEADVSSSSYGLSVSGGGDVNGDGFADWVVGAESIDLSTTNEGRVYAYYGNDRRTDAPSRPRKTLAIRSAGSRVGWRGFTGNGSALRLQSKWISVAGGSPVRLEAQVEHGAVRPPFEGPRTIGLWRAPSFGDADLLVPTTPNEVHRYRLRVNSRHPYFGPGTWTSNAARGSEWSVRASDATTSVEGSGDGGAAGFGRETVTWRMLPNPITAIELVGGRFQIQRNGMPESHVELVFYGTDGRRITRSNVEARGVYWAVVWDPTWSRRLGTIRTIVVERP